MAEAAWTAIQKRLEDEDPDVNRVWLEAVNCSHLHPSVRGEVGLLKSDECLDVSASCPHLTVSEIQYYVCIFPRNWVTVIVGGNIHFQTSNFRLSVLCYETSSITTG